MNTFEDFFEATIKDWSEEHRRKFQEKSLSTDDATKLIAGLNRDRTEAVAQSHKYRARPYKANQNFANDNQVLVGYLDSAIQRIKDATKKG